MFLKNQTDKIFQSYQDCNNTIIKTTNEGKVEGKTIVRGCQ